MIIVSVYMYVCVCVCVFVCVCVCVCVCLNKKDKMVTMKKYIVIITKRLFWVITLFCLKRIQCYFLDVSASDISGIYEGSKGSRRSFIEKELKKKEPQVVINRLQLVLMNQNFRTTPEPIWRIRIWRNHWIVLFTILIKHNYSVQWQLTWFS